MLMTHSAIDCCLITVCRPSLWSWYSGKANKVWKLLTGHWLFFSNDCWLYLCAHLEVPMKLIFCSKIVNKEEGQNKGKWEKWNEWINALTSHYFTEHWSVCLCVYVCLYRPFGQKYVDISAQTILIPVSICQWPQCTHSQMHKEMSLQVNSFGRTCLTIMLAQGLMVLYAT